MQIQLGPKCLAASLCLMVTALSGCPQIFFGIPAALRADLRFTGAGPSTSDSEFVPVDLAFEKDGRPLLFRMRVNGVTLEPTTGGCRRWFLHRVAREAGSAPRKFCQRDTIHFYLESGKEHTIDLRVGSEHTVAERGGVYVGRRLRWTVPIATRAFRLALTPEPGASYTIEAVETDLHIRTALGDNAPDERARDLDQYEAVFSSGVQVGTAKVKIVRNADNQAVSSLSVPIYSGRMTCGPPFCGSD